MARSFEDPRDCGDIALPSWDAMVAPLFGLPFLSLNVAFVLWLILKFVYRGLWRLKCFRGTINTHVGNNASPIPRSIYIVVSMLYGQLALSLTTILIFILKTYMRNGVPTPLIWAEAGLGVVLLCDTFFSGIKQEFYLGSLFDLGIIVDIATIPGMIIPWIEHVFQVQLAPKHSHWITLSFLRAIQAVSASEKLRALRPMHTPGGEEGYEIIKSLVRFLALISCFSSMVLVFEVLGEPACLNFTKFPTAMGDIDFFTMVYWVMETVSTVGYGDFSPKTVLSKWCTIVGMFCGVAFFSIQVGNFLQIVTKQKQGTGSYKKSKHGHIVLVGGGICHTDETLLVAFVQELFHMAYKSHWPDMVVLSGDGESLGRVRDIIDISVDHQARQHMTFLLGSPLNVADLDRCGGDTAKCIYILSDTTGHQDPWNEDKENMVRALSVLQRFPQTQLRLMLLTLDSVERALSMGIAKHMCFSINQMKSGLFWQSCRCVGWSSLLSNLMVTTDAVDADDKDESDWMRAYLGGMDHEIYGFLPVSEFQNVSFSYLVQEAYKRKGVCIFAAQISGDIVLAPLRQLQTVGFTVLFALAADEENLRGIALESHATDWQKVFAKRRAAYENKGGVQAAPIRAPRSFTSAIVYQDLVVNRFSSAWATDGRTGGGSHSQPRGSKAASLHVRDASGRSRPRSGGSVQTASSAVTSTLSAGSSRRHTGNIKEEGDAEVAGRIGGSSRHVSLQDEPSEVNAISTISCGGTLDMSSSYSFAAVDSITDEQIPEQLTGAGLVRAIRDLEARATRMRSDSASTPFVVVLELTGSLEQLTPILVQRMSGYLPFRLPMVVLCEIHPKDVLDVIPGLVDDQNFAFVQGTPFWVPDLERAGVRECAMIVSIGQGVTRGGLDSAETAGIASELVSMLDVDVVLLHRMIVNLSESPRNMLFDFQRTENMRLLPRPPASTKAALSDNDGDEPDDAEDPLLGAAGYEEALPPCCDRRFASGEIFTTQVFASLFARTYHSPGAVEVTQALITPDSQMTNSADSRANFTWQVKLTPEQVKMTYGELLMSMTCAANPVLPLGMYRSFGKADNYGNGGFVWTNPPADTVMEVSDMLYVLGDQIFGHSAYMQGLLPMTSSS